MVELITDGVTVARVGGSRDGVVVTEPLVVMLGAITVDKPAGEV